MSLFSEPVGRNRFRLYRNGLELPALPWEPTSGSSKRVWIVRQEPFKGFTARFNSSSR